MCLYAFFATLFAGDAAAALAEEMKGRETRERAEGDSEIEAAADDIFISGRHPGSTPRPVGRVVRSSPLGRSSERSSSGFRGAIRSFLGYNKHAFF